LFLSTAQAWLDPVNLPIRQQLTCSTTGECLQFLLQVYCPRDANPDQGFHRTLFLFISSRGDQLAAPGAVRALRCQLPRANPFYGFHPAPQEQQLPQPLQVGGGLQFI
jgi:pre-rRNA-processing protein TSR4